MKNQERHKATQRVTIIGALLNVFLGTIKIVFGVLGHSQALIADGIHSFSDLLTDFTVLVASKFGNQQPDLEHPYGHGRIETLGTLIIATIIIIVGAGIAYDAIGDILSSKVFKQPTISVIVVALISIFSNEWLFRYTLKLAKPIHSDLLASNAWHHRSDAFTSIVVLIGAGGAMLGIHHLDSIAAILVSFFITKMGMQLIWKSLSELIDTGVDKDTLNKIDACIKTVNGVVSIHQLRTRSMGGAIFVDVHVLVSPLISVSEGHYISEQVGIHLKKQFTNIRDVTVHIDPENDELQMISVDLPHRDIIEKELKNQLETLDLFNEVNKINLHYLAGKLQVEIFITSKPIDEQTKQTLSQAYKNAILNLTYVKKMDLYFTSTEKNI